MTFSTPFSRSFSRSFEEHFSAAGRMAAGYSPACWFNNLGESNQTATNTRTSTATAFDHEGVLVEGEAGEIMLDGGRREQNLLANSSDFTDPSWSPHDSLVGALDVDGFNEIANTAVNSLHGVNDYTYPAKDVRRTVEAKAGTADFLLLTSHPSSVPGVRGTFFNLSSGTIGTIGTVQQNPTIEDMGGGVYRCSIDAGGSGATGFTVAVAETDGVDKYVGTGKSIHVRRPMCQNIAGRTNTLPSEFLDSETDYGSGVNGVKWYSTTNGNTVSGGVVTAAPGVAISPIPQVLMQPQRTNHAFPSSDFTHANWVKTNITAALDAVGIDGAPNSASTLTATAANGTVFNALTLASDSYVSSLYVKRKTGTGTIEFTDDGGTTYTDITSLINSSTYTGVEIATTQANPSIGVRITTSGDEVEVDAGQLEEGLVATTPIFTATAAVTRDNDLIEITDWSNFAPLTSGMLIIGFTPDADWAALGAEQLVYGGVSANLLYRDELDDGLKATDGTGITSSLSGHTPGNEVIAIVVWDATLNALAVDYTPDGGTTWHRDATPVVFSTLTADALLKLGNLIAEPYTQRGITLYSSLPPGSTTISDALDWAEANADAEITKIQG